MKNKFLVLCWTLFIFLTLTFPVDAGSNPNQEGFFASKPVPLIIALASLSLLPFVLMTATSYVKISVVLGILRNAIGAQQVPSTTITSAVAIILTFYVMQPTINQCYEKAKPFFEKKEETQLFSKENAEKIVEMFQVIKEPFRDFLSKNSAQSSIKLFMQMAHKKTVKDVKKDDFRVLLPAFLITELQEAFFIGFLIFLPFLIIELVVSNILLSLGMHMLNPTTISLPFKLLLFVSVSGWEIISRGLVMGYKF